MREIDNKLAKEKGRVRPRKIGYIFVFGGGWFGWVELIFFEDKKKNL